MSDNERIMRLQLPEQLMFLVNERWRNKAARGGRGGSKSWSFVDAILYWIQWAWYEHQYPFKVLCAREFMNTISDSVHHLICNRIEHHKLEDFFDIKKTEIGTAAGGWIKYRGLHANATEIKSFEDVDLCFVEEAQKVTDDSINVLTPTIRKETDFWTSEIWWAWNTGSENDPVYKRNVTDKRDDTKCVLINYLDNPWCPKVLWDEAERDKLTDPVLYRNKWLGEPLVGGQFYNTFGPHLSSPPFLFGDDIEGYIIGSLDHGIAHNTSFGLWVMRPHKPVKLYRVLSYSANGGTARTHAEEIHDRIAACIWTGGRFPDVVVADPSMWTTQKYNEREIRAFIDEYIDLFRERGRHTKFEKAVNSKKSRELKQGGCGIVKEWLREVDGVHRFRYYEDSNATFAEGMKRVVIDENDPEIYAKMDGDDEADEARYGFVKAWDMLHNQFKTNRSPEKKASKWRAEIMALEHSISDYSTTGVY